MAVKLKFKHFKKKFVHESEKVYQSKFYTGTFFLFAGICLKVLDKIFLCFFKVKMIEREINTTSASG